MAKYFSSLVVWGLFLINLAVAEPTEVSAMLNDCSSTSHAGLCDVTKKGFLSDWRDAQKGNYQAQRNVAICLTTGCDGAVIVNAIAGCSWRMIIQASDASLEPTERMSFKDACNLSKTDRRAALAQAEALFQKIYAKPMPLRRLLD